MIYGIDVGGTKIETAIFKSDLSKQDCWRVATPTQDYSLFLNTIREQVEKADKINGFKGKIGVGMPGLIDLNGRSLSANVPCANGNNVRLDLQKLLNREVVIENDCRCFALSEANLGAGQGYARVFGAIIGTGAAGGLCIDGKINSGHNGIMGEYGHISLPAFLQHKYALKTVKCGCGLTDCMENYVAGPGIPKLFKHLYDKDISTLQFSQQLDARDPNTLNAFLCYIDLLGYTFASIVHNHDPDIIVVGGGVSKIDQVIEALPDAIQRYIFKNVAVPPIVRAKFGDASGGRGAAILADQSM